MESVLEVPGCIAILIIVTSVAPQALHAYSMFTVGKRIVEREFKLNSGPLRFPCIAIIGTRLIFLGVAKLRCAYVYAIKLYNALRTHIASFLVILDIVLVFGMDIGNQVPHIVKSACIFVIYTKHDII